MQWNCCGEWWIRIKPGTPCMWVVRPLALPDFPVPRTEPSCLFPSLLGVVGLTPEASLIQLQTCSAATWAAIAPSQFAVLSWKIEKGALGFQLSSRPVFEGNITFVVVVVSCIIGVHNCRDSINEKLTQRNVWNMYYGWRESSKDENEWERSRNTLNRFRYHIFYRNENISRIVGIDNGIGMYGYMKTIKTNGNIIKMNGTRKISENKM